MFEKLESIKDFVKEKKAILLIAVIVGVSVGIFAGAQYKVSTDYTVDPLTHGKSVSFTTSGATTGIYENTMDINTQKSTVVQFEITDTGNLEGDFQYLTVMFNSSNVKSGYPDNVTVPIVFGAKDIADDHYGHLVLKKNVDSSIDITVHYQTSAVDSTVSGKFDINVAGFTVQKEINPKYKWGDSDHYPNGTLDTSFGGDGIWAGGDTNYTEDGVLTAGGYYFTYTNVVGVKSSIATWRVAPNGDTSAFVMYEYGGYQTVSVVTENTKATDDGVDGDGATVGQEIIKEDGTWWHVGQYLQKTYKMGDTTEILDDYPSGDQKTDSLVYTGYMEGIYDSAAVTESDVPR